MICSIIRTSDVRAGDHLYRYRWFEMQQGVAVRYPKLSMIYVVTNYRNTLTLVTLKEFKGRSCLRRVTYKEDANSMNKMQYNHNRPPDEIVQNALLLLNGMKTSPDLVRSLLADDLSQFARRCCTTVHEQWLNILHLTQEQIYSKNHFLNRKHTSRNSDAFNAALVSGMPFRQASQIGTDEFWIDNSFASHTEDDSSDQIILLSDDFSNKSLIFASTFAELSSDDESILT